MTQPHDYGYKDLFSHPHILKELLTSCVHESWVQDLDFSKASTIDKSFISSSKKKLESDLIWRIPVKSGLEVYLYILIEFQSTVDHFMALRMLRYILEFYSSLRKQDPKLRTLPPVFPILLYNGEARWTAPENFADLIDNRISLDFIPQFRYFKIAENGLVPVPDWVRAQLDAKEVPTMLATNLKKWEQELIQKGLQQGIFKGKQEGFYEGEKHKALSTARKLKEKGLSIPEIAEVTGLSIEEVEKS